MITREIGIVLRSVRQEGPRPLPGLLK